MLDYETYRSSLHATLKRADSPADSAPPEGSPALGGVVVYGGDGDRCTRRTRAPFHSTTPARRHCAVSRAVWTTMNDASGIIDLHPERSRGYLRHRFPVVTRLDPYSIWRTDDPRRPHLRLFLALSCRYRRSRHTAASGRALLREVRAASIASFSAFLAASSPASQVARLATRTFFELLSSVGASSPTPSVAAGGQRVIEDTWRCRLVTRRPPRATTSCCARRAIDQDVNTIAVPRCGRRANGIYSIRLLPERTPDMSIAPSKSIGCRVMSDRM